MLSSPHLRGAVEYVAINRPALYRHGALHLTQMMMLRSGAVLRVCNICGVQSLHLFWSA